MATKEKWVDLFEKVIGRKPTASEFQAGKQSNFDPKRLRRLQAKKRKQPQILRQQKILLMKLLIIKILFRRHLLKILSQKNRFNQLPKMRSKAHLNLVNMKNFVRIGCKLLKIILVENLPKKNLQKLRVKDSLTCLFGLNCSTRNYHRNR